MLRAYALAAICCCGVASSMAPGPRRRSTPTAPEPEATRRSWLVGALFPLGVGVAANAPFFALLVSRGPDATQRDAALTSWCDADYCTLLGGGSGYAPQSAGGGLRNYVPEGEDPDDYN